MHPSRLRVLALVPASLLLVFAGCSSDSDRPEMPLHAVPDFPTTMRGSATFADGKLVAEVTLGQASGYGPRSGNRDSSGAPSGRHGGSGHHSGGGMGGGMNGGMGGGMGASYSGSSAGGETMAPATDSNDAPPTLPGKASADSFGPPDDSSSPAPAPRRGAPGGSMTAQLKLHLTNTSATEAVNCEVFDFKSSLGDFAVFPGKYQIAAGQSAVSETMSSQLGVNSAEIPVTVALRIEGRTESKVVIIKLLAPPAKDTPPAAGPGK